MGGSKLAIGIAGKRRQIEQNSCIDRYVEVVDGLSISLCTNDDDDDNDNDAGVRR